MPFQDGPLPVLAVAEHRDKAEDDQKIQAQEHLRDGPPDQASRSSQIGIDDHPRSKPRLLPASARMNFLYAHSPASLPS